MLLACARRDLWHDACPGSLPDLPARGSIAALLMLD
jgi:hypothetical protein